MKEQQPVRITDRLHSDAEMDVTEWRDGAGVRTANSPRDLDQLHTASGSPNG